MKGHFLVSHYILDRSAQAQVFVTTGPVFGVNEESILAVSPQNFQGKGEIFIWDQLLWIPGIASALLSIDCGQLWTRTKFLMKLDIQTASAAN